MPSNLSAMECTKDRIVLRAVNGAEWTITRGQIMAIYQGKTGNAASRRTATIADIKASARSVLGAYFDDLLTDLDFDPADSNRELLVTLRGPSA